MALKLLDGTAAAFDITINALSYKCLAAYVSADIVREFTERTTFCTTGGWRSRTPGMKQLIGRIDGFLTSGMPISDPSLLFANTTGYAFVITFDTGCTVTGTLHVGRMHMGLRAQANSEEGIDFESDGQVTFVWVVA